MRSENLQKMLDAFEDELYSCTTIQSSTAITASEMYIDDQGMFGDPGFAYSQEDFIDIWDMLHEDDPSISEEYGPDEMDRWIRDTKRFMTPWTKYSGADSIFSEVKSKQVLDSDGFYTDYTMYAKTSPDGEREYVFVFGDRDLYRPEDGGYDYECDTYAEAIEWFDDYNGFDEDEF